MLFRTRIVLTFGVGILATAAAVAAPFWVVHGLDHAALTQLRQAGVEAEWYSVMSDITTPQAVRAALLAHDEKLLAALAGGDEAAASTLLRNELDHADGTVRRIDILGADERLVASTAADTMQMIRGVNLRAQLAREPWLFAVESTTGGNYDLVTVSPLAEGRLVAIGSPIQPAIDEMASSYTRQVFLIGRRGRLVFSTLPDAGPAVAASLQASHGASTTLTWAGRDSIVIPVALLDVTGVRIATLAVMLDSGVDSERSSLVLLLAVGGGLLLFGVLCLGIYRYTAAALYPLAEITRVIEAVADGNTSVSADLPARKDEIGVIQMAVEIFRRDMRALARIRIADTLHRVQQQALIRREMEKLAGIVDETEHAEMAANSADNGGGSAALATAFKAVAARVIAQHGRLTELLEAQRRDLEIVREALSERAQLTRMREELEVARELQLSSLPNMFPAFPDRDDFEVFAAMQPAKEVGGDFYDFFLIGADRLVLMIGDASGKGVSAAIFIAMCRSLLRSAIVRGASPAEALRLANDALSADNPRLMFATVFIAILDLPTGRLAYASAGHNPPYLLSQPSPPGGSRAASLNASHGIALGVMPEIAFDHREDRLPPGSLLVMFTDGVTEAHGPDQSLFGDDRLSAAVSALADTDAQGAVTGLQRIVHAFEAGAEPADDVTIMAVHYRGPAARLGASRTRAPEAAARADMAVRTG